MTTVGIIGSGNIGGTVAKLAVAAGHDVVVSNSRGPETLGDLVNALGPRARAATAAEAAEAGDLLLLSVPIKAYPALTDLPVAGKVVMDTGNYYPERDAAIPALLDKTVTGSEYLAQHLAGAEVVKVFNNIFFKHLLHLARPVGAADRSFLPVAGDSDEAKAAVMEFLSSIGYGAVDAGPLAEGWRWEPGTPAYGPPYGTPDIEQGTPVGIEDIRAALAAATR
jgi:predicted dinucleotide-binding enzyme